MSTKDVMIAVAADEAWDDSTCVHVLSSALDALIAKDATSQHEVHAFIEQQRALNNDPPCIGDHVEFEGSNAILEIASIPDHQPTQDAGIFEIIDQFGHSYKVVSNGQIWVVESFREMTNHTPKTQA